MSNTATQFKPGQSGNPNGAPKKEWTMSSLIKESLEEEDEDGVPYKVVISRKLRHLASRGDIAAIKELNNRIDGMPKQDIDLKGEVKSLVTIDTKEGDSHES